MRIAVNTRLLLTGRLEGIGRYTFETLRHIVKQHPEHTFYFLFDRKWSPEFIFSDNIVPLKVSPPTRHPVLWFIWLEWSVPRILRKIKADLFLSPDGFLSLTTSVRSVAVIHDLNFHHRPHDLPLITRVYYRFFFPRFARKAVRVATVSEYSRKDLVLSYGLNPAGIDLTPNGVTEAFRPLPASEIQHVQERLTQGEPYFVFVGALHPRKNVPRLLEAYDIYRSRPGATMKLVIVGGKMFGNRELEQTLIRLKHRRDVIFTGRVPQEELYSLLGAAHALVFVPLFEGFGMPILEAMGCDVPVITSAVTSMPEVAGDAALYADPEIVESIAGAMIRMAEEPGLHEKLVAHARIRRNRFSWDLTAKNLWECIEKAMKENE